ncbi:uncharacterized protein [Choristoneura fumiferana]|uniref:uncharacterized protein n=1 Tax=Choristoneura fumiferana TaxID=7141 RepID=UPI003D15C40B
MAQAEDTELRDLVIEALEKNGSLAKIRALLRANIFLAFEDECENMKQNANLDNILKLPEGVLALTIVHEFLEFCNLKNTLFVYMSESRQGREYAYEGRDVLAERLQFINGSHSVKEPVLLTLLKNLIRPYQRKYYEQGDAARVDQHGNTPANHKENQNCTYIVHEDSSTSTSNSNSDNSSDEKNKLHLKLPLDNSDTDTSSDSTREKSSEYIPNQHILSQANTDVELSLNQPLKRYATQNESSLMSQGHMHEVKGNTNNSSDSTSYVDIKSYKMTDLQSIPSIKIDGNAENSPQPAVVGSSHQDIILKADSVSSATSNIDSLSQKNYTLESDSKVQMNSKSANERTKSDTEATEYSLDFSSSPASRTKNVQDKHLQSPEHVQDNTILKDKTSPNESPRQNSQSSQSSVSISDVADLIEYSDRNVLYDHSLSKENPSLNSPSKTSHKSKNVSSDHNKNPSDDSGDFSESPIPSLSNLSLDVHSD